MPIPRVSFRDISLEIATASPIAVATSVPRYPNQHFLTTAQRDLLTSVESGRSESTDAANYGTYTRAFTAAEDSTK